MLGISGPSGEEGIAQQTHGRDSGQVEAGSPRQPYIQTNTTF